MNALLDENIKGCEPKTAEDNLSRIRALQLELEQINSGDFDFTISNETRLFNFVAYPSYLLMAAIFVGAGYLVLAWTVSLFF